MAYRALYVSVGFPIRTHKYAHVQPKAEVIAGLRSRLSDQFQPSPALSAMVGARSGLLRSADTSNTIAREFRPAAGLSRRLIVSAVMLNLARAQIASLVVIPPVRRTY